MMRENTSRDTEILTLASNMEAQLLKLPCYNTLLSVLKFYENKFFKSFYELGDFLYNTLPENFSLVWLYKTSSHLLLSTQHSSVSSKSDRVLTINVMLQRSQGLDRDHKLKGFFSP